MSRWSPRKAWYYLKEPGTVVLQTLAAAHLLTLVACPVPCAGLSMTPTFNYEGDAVIVSALPYWRPRWMWGGGRRPRHGELVAYPKPTEPRTIVLKRVVALEGDIVEVDPRRDTEAWGGGPPSPASRWGEGKYIRVPKGHVWCVGDNLSNSTDSRDYGPVPIASIKGMAIARLFTSRFFLPWWEPVDTNVRIIGESPHPFVPA